MPTENKPLKAYSVGEDSEGGCVVVFASNSATARREGGNELNLEFCEVDFCRRAPWADRYAGQPFIPAKAYHDNGWWVYCGHCENRVYEDAEDEDGNPLALVYDGRHAYCSQDCKDGRDKEIADHNAKGEAFKALVQALRPDLTFTKWHTGWPYVTQHADFTFPGSQYGGSVRDRGVAGEVEWSVAQGDKAAWYFYESQRKSAA